MTVYVESNFVLEIALGQRQAASAELILESAIAGKIALAVPSLAVFEPFSTVMHNGQKRRELMNRMKGEIDQLRRSQPHEREILGLEPMAGLFAEIEQREKRLLTDTVRRVFEVASILELDASVFGSAVDIARGYGFSKMTDAIICAAILEHLKYNTFPGPHYFATRDAADFSDPGIVERFADLGCTIVYRFDECAQRLRLHPA